jgi:thymidylate synthase
LLLASNETSQQPSRGGDTLELLHVALEIGAPSQRWVVSRTPPLNPAFALVEALWIAAGRRDASLPTYWNPLLRNYCGDADYYHGAYGYRLRHQFGFDQLDRVYHALESSPNTRQCVLQIWNSATDMPLNDGSPVNPDIPCNIAALPKVRQGRLEWLQVIRSNDLFLGVPHNIVQFTVLQEILSGWLRLEVGPYVQVSDSMHIYIKDVDAVKSSLTPIDSPQNPDTFALDRSTWERIFPGVMRRLDALTLPSLTTADFKRLAFTQDTPAAYENAVLVAAADAARRRGWRDQVDESIGRCTNPTLQHLWTRWLARCEAHRSDAGNMEYQTR